MVPAELYFGDETLDCLHEAMVQDLISLYNRVFQFFGCIHVQCLSFSGNALYDDFMSFMCNEVQCGEHSFCLRFVPICIKGDWPYLRKAGHLQTGFRSKVVCHLCNNPVTGLNTFL